MYRKPSDFPTLKKKGISIDPLVPEWRLDKDGHPVKLETFKDVRKEIQASVETCLDYVLDKYLDHDQMPPYPLPSLGDVDFYADKLDLALEAHQAKIAHCDEFGLDYGISDEDYVGDLRKRIEVLEKGGSADETQRSVEKSVEQSVESVGPEDSPS